MKDQNETQAAKSRQERITVSPESASRVDHWIDEVRWAFPAVRVSRSNLIDWLINSRSEKLTSKEVNGIKETFFDEVAFTEWALRALKDARSRGENLSLADIMAGNVTAVTEPKKERRPRKSNPNNSSKEEPNAEDGNEGAVGTTSNPIGIVGASSGIA